QRYEGNHGVSFIYAIFLQQVGLSADKEKPEMEDLIEHLWRRHELIVRPVFQPVLIVDKKGIRCLRGDGGMDIKRLPEERRQFAVDDFEFAREAIRHARGHGLR